MSAQLKAPKVPASYFCSITSQIMIDPVVVADGYTYEREAIEKWLSNHDTSPRTNLKLKHKELTDNHDKRSDILEFLDEHPDFYERDEVYLPKSWGDKLVAAIKGNQLSAVQEWLSKDRRLLTLKLEGDYTALHLASQFGSPELVKILLKSLTDKALLPKIMNPPIDFKPIHLNSLLEKALEKMDKPNCSLLLKLGAELEQLEPTSQNTLLHRLVGRGNPEPVRLLLEQSVSLESHNMEGNTPLLLAVLQGHLEITKCLLEHKANVTVKNLQHQSPISIALLNKRFSILSLLVGTKNAALPPLHLALELNDIELIKALLTEKTVALEALDEQQRTPLMAAVEKGNLAIVELLLTKGANPAVTCGILSSTPLHSASAQGNLDMVKRLLQTKINIDALDREGNTPLHLVAKGGKDAVIPLLLEAGAYHKAKNHQGQTPIELARQQNKFQSAHLIEQIARGNKKAKLEQIDVLRQITREQSAKIEQLEKTLGYEKKEQLTNFEKLTVDLQSQQQQGLRPLQKKIETLEQEKGVIQKEQTARYEENKDLKKQMSEMQKMMEQMQSQLSTNNAPQSNIIQNNPIVPQYQNAKQSLKVSLSSEVKVNSKEMNAFLNFVVGGQQDEAEEMLKKAPELGLASGDVTDHAKRTFKNITGFQYAVWALDWHMWTMLRKYLPIEAAREQAKGFGEGSWVKEHGEYVSWKRLLDAQQTYIDNYSKWDYTKCNEHWVQQVGGAQLILPMHVLQEYCHPTRPFDPCPNFKDSSKLARSLSKDVDLKKLGMDIGIVRGNRWNKVTGGCWSWLMDMGVSMECCFRDLKALAEMSSTRTQQRGELVAELKSVNKPDRQRP